MISGVLGFLGFGNMGQAIARGLVKADLIAPANIALFDVDADKARSFADAGFTIADSADALVRQSDAVLLAPKPQDMAAALESMRAGWQKEVLVISIAAGISTEFIQKRLGPDARVARVMPNTPALVAAGAAGIAYGAGVTDADRSLVRAIFDAVGIAEEVEEAQLDAVTALSGSGPAYYFYLVECFVAGAVKLGLDEDQAGRLAAQTLLGAGKLLTESGEPPSILRERVTSKGGTTAAALDVLRQRGWPETAAAALEAAAARSRELGQ
jgi:pyrroline-5-carboxylate reductase